MRISNVSQYNFMMALFVQEPDNFSKCSNEIPSVKQYFKATNEYGIALICVGSAALLISLVLFIDTFRYVIKNSSSKVKAHTAFVTAVYPVICLLSYFAILVPRCYLVSEALTQGMFMAGMYQLFCLYESYSGGEAQLVQKAKATRLSLKVGPCCCWLCCSCLPTFKVTKNTVKYLKLLVLQLPLVQILVYFVILVMWSEAENLYEVNYWYLQPIIILSLLCGIWGMLMTTKLLVEILSPEFLLKQKFGVLQMVLVFAKLQGFITRILIWFDVLPCNTPISPQVYANMINNSLLILEMVLLGLLARNLYKRQIPNMRNSCNNSTQDGIISTIFGNVQEKIGKSGAAQGADNTLVKSTGI